MCMHGGMCGHAWNNISLRYECHGDYVSSFHMLYLCT